MRTIKLAFLLAFLFPVSSKAQSLSLPAALPVHCANPVTTCTYPATRSGQTGIIIAVGAASATLSDQEGNVWSKDFCATFDGGNCIFSTRFKYAVTYPLIDAITFISPVPVVDVFMFIYDGVWSFEAAAQGDYAHQNSVFPDCVNGGDCPYNWTAPLEADAGNLLISWSNLNAQGTGLPKPGLGWLLEATDSKVAVMDMLAPVEGTYIGSLIWKLPDGTNPAASHWIMGLAAYRRIL